MNTKCQVCGKTAYPMESVAAEGKHYHKTCFKCEYCHNALRLGSYAALSGKFYCKPHFKQLFQLKGNYSGGFGEDKPTAKWDAQLSGSTTIPTSGGSQQGSTTTTTSTSGSHPVGGGVKHGGGSTTSTSGSHPVSGGGPKPMTSTTSKPKPVPSHVEPLPPPADPSFVRPTISFQGLTMEEFEDAQGKFRHFDTDGSGSIDKEEFFNLMKAICAFPMNDRLLRKMSDLAFEAADADHSGGIDEVEFLVVYSDLHLGKFKVE